MKRIFLALLALAGIASTAPACGLVGASFGYSGFNAGYCQAPVQLSYAYQPAYTLVLPAAPVVQVQAPYCPPAYAPPVQVEAAPYCPPSVGLSAAVVQESYAPAFAAAPYCASPFAFQRSYFGANYGVNQCGFNGVGVNFGRRAFFNRGAHDGRRQVARQRNVTRRRRR